MTLENVWGESLLGHAGSSPRVMTVQHFRLRIAEVVKHQRLGTLVFLDTAEAEMAGEARLRRLQGAEARVFPGQGSPSFDARIWSVEVTVGIAGRIVAGFQLEGAGIPEEIALPATMEIRI